MAELTALGDPAWRRVTAPTLDALSAADWAALDAQRRHWMAEARPKAFLRALAGMAEETSFGYETNLYRHCLIAATRALEDGRDEETVVVCLLHDIGYSLNQARHGEIAALSLGPFVSEANEWMLRHHQVFLDAHAPGDPTVDADARERWRGHPYFAWTAEFCDRYDQSAIAAAERALPLAAFEPMVHRVLGRAPRAAR
jgi:predicted HD phosphohydrolase